MKKLLTVLLLLLLLSCSDDRQYKEALVVNKDTFTAYRTGIMYYYFKVLPSGENDILKVWCTKETYDTIKIPSKINIAL